MKGYEDMHFPNAPAPAHRSFGIIVGDVVTLNVHGAIVDHLPMCVEKIDGDVVSCVWFEGQHATGWELRRARFFTDTLTRRTAG